MQAEIDADLLKMYETLSGASAPMIPPNLRFASVTGREWSRGHIVILADRACRVCGGLGGHSALGSGRDLQPSARSNDSVWRVCGCVTRAVFRECHERYLRASAAQQAAQSMPRWEGGTCWARPHENYRADFCNLARRALTPTDYRVFEAHFLCGLEWGTKACLKIGLTRGNFYHAVYRIQHQLGRVYYETQPYALWPGFDEAGAGGANHEYDPLFLIDRRGTLRPAQGRFGLAVLAGSNEPPPTLTNIKTRMYY
jgi:hypothetical protein